MTKRDDLRRLVAKGANVRKSSRQTFIGDAMLSKVAALITLNGRTFRTQIIRKTTDRGAVFNVCPICKSEHFATILIRQRVVGTVSRGSSVNPVMGKIVDRTHFCPNCGSRFLILDGEVSPDDFSELPTLNW